MFNSLLKFVPSTEKKVAASVSLIVTMGVWGLAALGWAQRPETRPALTNQGSSRGALQSIRILPAEATLRRVGAAHRFLVVGQYEDGLERDVTRESHFSVSDSSVAEVDHDGRVLGRAHGKTVLTVTCADAEAAATVRVERSEHAFPFSFAWDIGSILTQRGCNSSECHGGITGQGGFKLSRNAISPHEDYRWIVEGGTFDVLSADPGPQNPRINLDHSEQSLLLLKPTLAVDHGGDERFTVGSPDYTILLDWIRRGAPYGDEQAGTGTHVRRLEVFPSQVILDQRGQQQLLVTAHRDNGQHEDITDQVRYVSQNTEVVVVTPEGMVQAVGLGETVIRVHTAGRMRMVTVGVISKPIADYPVIQSYNFIDEHVLAKLRKFHLLPSPLASDAEFLRRICLDLTGTLPPPRRVREFLSDDDPKKRTRLIEILLETPEFVDHWTWRFGDFLRVVDPLYEEWLHNSLAQNKPYDQLARERVAAQGYDGPSRHFTSLSAIAVPHPHSAMAEQVRVFLGHRLDCAQCHDHPYEDWTQDQFWELSAFFGHLSNMHPGLPEVDFVIRDDPTGFGVYGEGAKVIHPRTKKEVQPRLLDGTPVPEHRRDDLRLALAEWMTSSDNPYFSKAAVNRMWGYFFGRGIVDPVDDFGSAHPPTHPELLETLAREFIENGYDLKNLIHLIVESRTYQLSGTPNETDQHDQVNYARALPRPLEAEVLLKAISQVCGCEGENGRFLNVYEKPDRSTIPDRNSESSLARALHQWAGPTFTSKLSAKGGRIDQMIRQGAADEEIIEEFYLRALSRFPSTREQSLLAEMIQRRDSRMVAIEDMLWGIINADEFLHNH